MSEKSSARSRDIVSEATLGLLACFDRYQAQLDDGVFDPSLSEAERSLLVALPARPDGAPLLNGTLTALFRISYVDEAEVRALLLSDEESAPERLAVILGV